MAELRSSDVLAKNQGRKYEHVFTTQPKQISTYQHTIDITATQYSQRITYYGIDDYDSVSLGINDQLVELDNNGEGQYIRNEVGNKLDPQIIKVQFFNDGHTILFILTASDLLGLLKPGQAKGRVLINYKIPIFNLKLHKVVAGCLETNSGDFVELQTGISHTKNLLQFTNGFIYYPQGNDSGSPYDIQYYIGHYEEDTHLGDYDQVKNAGSQIKKLVFYTIGD